MWGEGKAGLMRVGRAGLMSGDVVGRVRWFDVRGGRLVWCYRRGRIAFTTIHKLLILLGFAKRTTTKVAGLPKFCSTFLSFSTF